MADQEDLQTEAAKVFEEALRVVAPFEGQGKSRIVQAPARTHPIETRRSEPVTPIPASDHKAVREMKRVNRLIRLLPKRTQDNIRNGYGLFFRQLRHAYFLTQLAERNAGNPFVQQYLEGVREMVKVRTKALLEADSLNRQWHKVGGKTLNKVAQVVRLVEQRSKELDRRLTNAEIQAIIEPLDATKEQKARIFELWEAIDNSMQKALGMLKSAMMKEADRQYGLIAPLRRRKSRGNSRHWKT